MRRNSHSKKKKLTKIFIALAAIAAVSYGVSTYLKNKQENGDVVIAKINNEKIYKSEINGKIREVFAGGEDIELPAIETFPPEVVETFAKEIYLERELVARAKKAGITKQEEVKAQIENTQNRIISNAYLNSVIKDKVSEEKIREKYSELSNNLAGKKEYSVAHIVVKTKAEAEKIRESLTSKKAKNRANFADLAKKYSLDKESAAAGGKLGYVAEESLAKEILESANSLKKGEFSKPVETKSGWHIIKVEDIRESKGVAFEDAKESIREQMIKEETGAIYKEIFDKIKVEVLIKREAAMEKNESATEEAGATTNVNEDEKASEEQVESESSEPAAESAETVAEPEAEPAAEPAKAEKKSAQKSRSSKHESKSKSKR